MLKDRAHLGLRERELYKRSKKMYTKQLKTAKIRSNESFISNSNNKCKAAWSIISKQTGCKTNQVISNIYVF